MTCQCYPSNNFCSKLVLFPIILSDVCCYDCCAEEVTDVREEDRREENRVKHGALRNQIDEPWLIISLPPMITNNTFDALLFFPLQTEMNQVDEDFDWWSKYYASMANVSRCPRYVTLGYDQLIVSTECIFEFIRAYVLCIYVQHAFEIAIFR